MTKVHATSPQHYISLFKSRNGQQEQMALLIYPLKVELVLNSNYWSSEEKIGLYEIRDQKIVAKIKNEFKRFNNYNGSGKDSHKNPKKIRYPSRHDTQVSIDGQKIHSNSFVYKQALDYFYYMQKVYPWKDIDSIRLEGLFFKSSKNVKKELKANCAPEQKRWACRGKFGVIYTSSLRRPSLHKQK